MRRALAAAAAALALASTAPASAAPQVTGTWSGTGGFSSGYWYSVLPVPGDVKPYVKGPFRGVGGATSTCYATWWEDPSGYATGTWRSGYLTCSGDVTTTMFCVTSREGLVVHLACVGALGEAAEANLVLTPSTLNPTWSFDFTGALTYVAPG